MPEPPAASPSQGPPPIPRPKSLWDFIENTYFLFALAIVAALMGILISLMLVVCGVLFVLAFYRSEVVSGKPIRVQIAAYVGLIVIIAPGLYGVYFLVDSRSPRFPTATEIASEIVGKIRGAFSPPKTSSFPAMPSPSRRENIPKPPMVSPQPPSRGPRLGMGPEAYKDLSDGQVGQWAVEEADKITEMAEDCINKSIAAMKEKRSGNAERWFFSNDFKKCCAQDVKDLRTEILRRLGPPGKDPKEESALEMLFLTPNIPGRPDDINPMMVTEYAKHLRRLGLKLKRRSVPRSAPRELRFTEQQITPEKPDFPYKILITVHADKDISVGYIVVQWSGNWGIIHGHDLEGGKALFSSDIMDNDPLTRFLEVNRDPVPYSIQIGSTPFIPSKPVHVLASNNKPFHVNRVIFFDQ